MHHLYAIASRDRVLPTTSRCISHPDTTLLHIPALHPAYTADTMPVPTSRDCATCSKPCYPTEKVMVSDLWVHKNGCLKVSRSAYGSLTMLISIIVLSVLHHPLSIVRCLCSPIAQLVDTRLQISIRGSFTSGQWGETALLCERRAQGRPCQRRRQPSSSSRPEYMIAFHLGLSFTN